MIPQVVGQVATDMSLIQTKGWHVDVTDTQVDTAAHVLDSLNRTGYPVYYSEAHQPDDS